MFLKYSIALAASFLIGSTSTGMAAETNQVLFSNPLVRDSTALPKLQSLRFVTVDGFAPFSAFDANGTLRGVHVDLARAICSELKINTGCTLQAVAFEDVENLLISGQADVALAGIVPTPQNRKNLAFSVPYFRYPSKFLEQKGATLKNGALIGVVRDSAHQKMAETLFPQFKRMAFANDGEAIAALKAGTVSAVFGDGLKLAAGQTSNQMAGCCELKPENYFLPALRPDTLSAANSNSRADVSAAVDSALRQMAVDGRLDEIYLRYMPVNPLK
jgi:polar amino acid transport system substrate-binding protein